MAIISFRKTLLWIAVAAVAALSLAAVATAGALPVFFTDNLRPQADEDAVTPLEQGLLDHIKAATTSIDAALYEFDRASIRDALLAAHGRGVTVRVVTDDETRSSGDDGSAYRALAQAGIAVVDDGSAGGASRIHDKYFIFDRSSVWTASANLTSKDIVENHNNALLLTSPAIAAVYQHDFDAMFGGKFGSAKTPSSVTQATYNGHEVEIYFSPQDGALDKVIAEVEAARATIDFAILQLRDDRLAQALAAAQARGVQVRGLMDAKSAGDGGSDDEALCAAGVAVRVEATPGRMHHKLMIIDAGLPQGNGAGPRVVAGSLNWTEAGRDISSENTVILHDPHLIAAYAGEFEKMWAAMPAVSECNLPPLGQLPAQLYLPAVTRR